MRVTIAYDAANEIIDTDVEDYSISLTSTPLNSNDSSGSVGEFSVTFRKPLDPDNDINVRGMDTLEGREVQFTSHYGTIYGVIHRVTENNHSAITIECTSYAGGLNAYNVQSPPFTGPLWWGLTGYFALGTSAVNVVVDPAIADRDVIYPGWEGELWYHLKMLCAAEDIQMVLTGQGYVYVEPVRQHDVSDFLSVSTMRTVDSSSLAQSVEIREYDCKAVFLDPELFYPRGGWSPEVPILSVGAGEYSEQVIDLAGSMTSFVPPVMQTFVSRDHSSSSVYTVVAEDGFPIQPAQWTDYGGSVSFELNNDSRSMTVKMQGAQGLPLASGKEATSFSLALSSDTGGSSRYSTLRITGWGVLHEDEKVFKVATGIPASVTGTDVGASIDNPFLFDRARVGRAASRAVREYSGAVLSAQGQVTSLGSGFGVDDVGGRIELGGRPYRVRNVSYSPGGASFTAEDDLLYDDMLTVLAGKTYQDVEDLNQGLTYRNVFARGTRYNGA